MCVGYVSSVDKLWFIFGNLDKVYMLMFIVVVMSFVVIMVCWEIKRRL